MGFTVGLLLLEHEAMSYTLHRRDDPDTSVQAAQAIGVHITKLQQQVMDYATMMGQHGFTDEGLSHFYDNYRSTLRTRRAELTERGYIVDSGRRVTLPTRRQAIVWQIRE